MFICISCYNSRGEDALVFDLHEKTCQFCDTESSCFEIPIYELKHWKEVAMYQGWASYMRG